MWPNCLTVLACLVGQEFTKVRYGRIPKWIKKEVVCVHLLLFVYTKQQQIRMLLTTLYVIPLLLAITCVKITIFFLFIKLVFTILCMAGI